MSVAEVAYTPEDLLTMPDGDSFELVDGQLVDRTMSQESSWIAGEVYARIREIVLKNDLGWVFPEGTSFQCFPDDPNRVRRPDTSFVQLRRQPGGPSQRGHGRVAPDLVVEVVSPNDLFQEVDEKVDEWLRAGVQLIWVINPRGRNATVIRPDADPRKLTERDELTGDPVLPGFACRIADLLLPRTETAQGNGTTAP
jgi:Uma2 family endonuclease